jgi:hypothetical protein
MGFLIFKTIVTLVLLFHVGRAWRDATVYGWRSVSPAYDLKTSTQQSLASAIQVNTTKKSDLYALFGKPDEEFQPGERAYIAEDRQDDRERAARYHALLWTKWTGFYLVLSINTATQQLVVYLNDDGTVQSYDLRTVH